TLRIAELGDISTRFGHAGSRRHPQSGIAPKDLTSFAHLSAGELSVEGHGCSILFVGHSREIVAGINVSCPAKEKFIESLKSAWSKWINDPSKADPHGKALRSRDWNQLKMVRERSDQREGLGDIAMSYSEPTGKVFHLVRKDGISHRLSDQSLDCSDVA